MSLRVRKPYFVITLSGHRGRTLSVLLDADKFVLHQPFDTGLYSAFVGVLHRRFFAVPFHAGSQQRAQRVRAHILWSAGHPADDDLRVGTIQTVSSSHDGGKLI